MRVVNGKYRGCCKAALEMDVRDCVRSGGDEGGTVITAAIPWNNKAKDSEKVSIS